MKTISKPTPGEYASYAAAYMQLVPDDGRLLDHLKENHEATRRFLLAIPHERLLYRYAEGKWTIKEILVHIADTERVFAYRGLRFARGDATALPGFEQDDYVTHSGANVRDLDDIIDELRSVREASISLFAGLPPEAFMRTGTASGNPLSVRAAAFWIVGHELHHINIIKERYLGGTP